jgi:hypothetical protein
MSAVRMVLMGVVGVGAGAFVALSTTPSFAPYRERSASRPYQDESEGGRAYAQAYASREHGAPEPERDLGVRLGDERGTLVLELPGWAGDTVEWMGFGRRVWDDWRQFSGRIEGLPDQLLGREREEQWRDQRSEYVDRDSPRRQERPRYGEGFAQEPEAPYAYEPTPRGYAPAEPGYAPGPQDIAPQTRAQPEADAATLAARRAQDAARDVMAAQGL